MRIRLARHPVAAAAAACGLVLCSASVAGVLAASHGGRAATPTGRTPFVAVPYGRAAPLPDAARPVTVAAPVGLVIPAIGVRTPLIRLGRTPSGALQVPGTTAVAGWYTGSPRPGEIGAAVIAGHVDSYLGPGVFFRLRLLRRGNLVLVRRANGSLVAFRVVQARLYLKASFPTAAVYGPAPAAELRLITCGGTFDPATGSYLSNVIVSAIEVPWQHRAARHRRRDRDRRVANIAV
jgi:sortase (surface protein transpeptidase)